MIELPTPQPVDSTWKPRVKYVADAEECVRDLYRNTIDQLMAEDESWLESRVRMMKSDAETGILQCSSCEQPQPENHIHMDEGGEIICSEGCAIQYINKYRHRHE